MQGFSRFLRGSVALAALLVATPLAAGPDTGAYLAARQAQLHNDFPAAALWLSQAMAADPDNTDLREPAMASFLAQGRLDQAAEIAAEILESDSKAQIAHLVLMAQMARDGDWDGVRARIEAGEGEISPLFDALAQGWAILGQGGEPEAAFAAFEEATPVTGTDVFARYHKALALLQLDRPADALEVFDGGEEPLPLDRRGALARAEALAALGRGEEVPGFFEETFGTDLDPALATVAEAARAGGALPIEIAPTPRSGLAEVYATIANALIGQAAPTYTLVHLRLSMALDPDNIEARLRAAVLLEDMAQYDLAIDVFEEVAPEAPSFIAAALGRAEALRAQGKTAEGLEALRALAKRPNVRPEIQIALGDALRQDEIFDEAAQVYTRALTQIPEESESLWRVIFTRGIAYERSDQWAEAEADFRRALELKPDQPQVLNYLGYSYVEQRENLDEALDMIRKAAEAEPDAGYIADSLGWVYYRLERYEEAVEPMERAVELMADDSLVNDHLGDVYWAVGRKREAEFQWRRALSFGPEDDDAAQRIRDKLEHGLDWVLEREAATGTPPEAPLGAPGEVGEGAIPAPPIAE